jgi:GT2 family glycosyltransferase
MTSAPEPDAAVQQSFPTVLVILVARGDPARLRACLAALAAQTYPRLGVLAIDDGTDDGSHELLVRALGAERVLRNERPEGIARCLARAAAAPVAEKADHLLVLHGDAAPDPDAVARLVEATAIPGVERVGIVGAKVVDWDRPRVLRDVGRSADRFGHPFSSLLPDELDQGQFDRVLDVLAVDGCAMLVARDVWRLLGLLDERLDGDGVLDLCWRARVGGWRVLMTPLARVRHAGGRPSPEHRRYEEDRAALATILKNYSPWSLLAVLPLAALLAAVRLVFLALTRRFEEAVDLGRAWWWNVVHLPGTLARRRRVQRSRRVSDRALRRFTASAGIRLPRWFQTAERIWEEQRQLDEADEPGAGGFRRRTVSLARAHPVVVGSTLAGLVLGLALRDLVGPEPLAGGILPAFPEGAGPLLAELVSATRSTGLGGPLAASPALAVVAAVSAIVPGGAAVAQKVVLAAAPVLSGVLLYRAAVRRTARPGASIVAALAYGASAIALWALSEARLSTLVALAALPPLLERIDVAFAAGEPRDGRRRLAAGLAVTLALGVAASPGVALPALAAIGLAALWGPARLRGLQVTLGATLASAVLLFPFVPTLAAGGGAALGSTVGTTDPLAVLRLALGPGPGTWPPALFLPAAAVLGLALARGPQLGRTWRTAVLAVLGLALAWASAVGWLPPALANAPTWGALAAAGQAFLVADGLASGIGGLGREAFGFRQIGTALLAVVLVAGLGLQSIAAVLGERAVGDPARIPAAWAVVHGTSEGAFRILWLGGDRPEPFPPPGGDPAYRLDAGPASLRVGLTGREGASILDLARPLAGPGADALLAALRDLVSGSTAHAGHALAPFGIRYLVAREGDLPPAVLAVLREQVDLDEVPAAGLHVFRNAAALPPAAALQLAEGDEPLIATPAPRAAWRLGSVRSVPLAPAPGGWAGRVPGGSWVVVGSEYDPDWRLRDDGGGSTAPVRAFGWALGFRPLASDAEVRVDYGAQLPRTLGVGLLAVLWAVALWVTRRPVAR